MLHCSKILLQLSFSFDPFFKPECLVTFPPAVRRLEMGSFFNLFSPLRLSSPLLLLWTKIEKDKQSSWKRLSTNTIAPGNDSVEENLEDDRNENSNKANLCNFMYTMPSLESLQPKTPFSRSLVLMLGSAIPPL